MKQIESAISHTINNYEQTSKLKQYRRLRAVNCKAITEAVEKNGQKEQLLELIKKRDYYNHKIYEMLNSAGEIRDPALIIDRGEAEHYISKRILRDQHKVASLRALIEKHARFQDKYKAKKEKIIDNHSSGSASFKFLKKLNTINSQLKAIKDAHKDTALNDMYLEAANEQRQLSEESLRTLRSLGIPYFDSGFNSANQVFVIDFLQSQLSQEKQKIK